MLRLIVTRLLILIPIMLLVTSIVFFMIRFVPGDPARIIVGNVRITEENLQNIRVQYNLDEPILTQYGLWLGDLAHGDLGRSYRQRADVTTLILERLPLTLQLATGAFIVSLLISIPLGIVSAVRRNSWVDVLATFMSLLGASSPVYFTSILLILLFSYKLGWMPPFGDGDPGIDRIRHLALPWLALGFSLSCITTRFTRSAMIDALTQDYIETARAKGLSFQSVVMKHALRNALIPIITVASLQFGLLLVGSVLVEETFALGGFGSLVIEAVQTRDYPVVQGATVFLAVTFIIINLLTDIAYALIDPRVRYGGSG